MIAEEGFVYDACFVTDGNQWGERAALDSRTFSLATQTASITSSPPIVRNPWSRFCATRSVHPGEDEQVLAARDSIDFDSSVPHAYRRTAGKSCCAVVGTSG